MSRTMIADETTPDGAGVDGRATLDGLGLWPEAIVSPHFAERRRMNPLMAIVRRHPDLIGIGIDDPDVGRKLNPETPAGRPQRFGRAVPAGCMTSLALAAATKRSASSWSRKRFSTSSRVARSTALTKPFRSV
jgi:hypothetical protein